MMWRLFAWIDSDRIRGNNGLFHASVCVFSSTKLPGITCTEQLIHGGGVFGADITLDRFTQSLERQKISGSLIRLERESIKIQRPDFFER